MVSSDLPVLDRTATMREAIVLLAERRGIAVIVEHQCVLGVITAGDLTRLLERHADVLSVPVASVMTTTPRMAQDHELGSAVVNGQEHLVGIVHLHDLMRAGAA